MEGPFHPLFVHFPIALYLLGVGLVLIHLWRSRPDFEQSAYRLFLLSWGAAIVSALVGLVDKGQLAFDDPRQGAMNNHITTAIAFIVLNGLLIYTRFRWPDALTSRRWQYLGLMLAGLALIVITGRQGGDLVYGLQIGIR